MDMRGLHLHGGGTITMVTSSHDSSATTFKHDSPQTLPTSVSLPLIPSLLVLNPTSLAKPNAIQQLHIDIISTVPTWLLSLRLGLKIDTRFK